MIVIVITSCILFFLLNLSATSEKHLIYNKEETRTNCAKQMDRYKIRSPTEHYCLLYAVTPNKLQGNRISIIGGVSQS